MAEVTCPECGKRIHRLTDHEYLINRGWKFVPWTPDHKSNDSPYRNPEHPHNLFTSVSALIRQDFYDYRDALPVVKCLWTMTGRVQDIYVNGKSYDGHLIGNPSGYDDWGRWLIPCKGELNGEKYDYVQGDSA